MQGTGLGRDRPPFRAAPVSFDAHETFGLHLPQDVTHHVSADAWAVVFQVGNAERPQSTSHRRANLVRFGSLERGDARLELVVRSNQDPPEIVEPGMSVVRVIVPRTRTALRAPRSRSRAIPR